MLPPLLSCESARIDVSGGPDIDGLNGESAGASVGLVGPWGPLFSVLARQRRVRAGRIRVGGHDAEAAVANGAVGLALFQPGLPRRWSVSQYLKASARLAGLSERVAEAEARSALERCQVSWLAGAKLGDLPPVHERLVVVLHATLGSPPILALETPLSGLDEGSQRQLAEAIGRAGAGRRLLQSVAEASPGSVERMVLDGFEEVWLLGPGGVLARGSAAEVLAAANRYLVVVTREARRLASVLVETGAQASLSDPERPASGEPGGQTAADARGGRLIVDLGPEQTPDVIVEAALAANSPIVEMLPLVAGSG
jgi:ABC-type multidrug transport system ATPase subunit